MKKPIKLFILLFLTGCTATMGSDPFVPEKYLFSRDVYESKYSRKRAIFILPGMGDSPYRYEYYSVAAMYYNHGFYPVFIMVDWNDFTLDKIDKAAVALSELLFQYPGYEVHVFGFSIGGAIALINADNTAYASMVLSSMSPVCDEDVGLQNWFIRVLFRLFSGNAFRKYSYPELQCEHLIFIYGEHDSAVISEDIINNRKEIYPRSSTIVIPDTGHCIEGTNYSKTLTSIIEGL